MAVVDSFHVDPAYAKLMREIGLDAQTIFTDAHQGLAVTAGS